MNANLPIGGKIQPNAAPAVTETRVVRIERLQKMSAEQLEAKIANLPQKIKRKTEITEKRIAKMREKLAAYESFKKAEVEVCKRLVVEKKKVVTTPNAGPAKAA